MSQLAVFGGPSVRNKPFPEWPVFDQNEEQAILQVLHSGQWWRNAFAENFSETEPADGRSKVGEFEKLFAAAQGGRFGIACTNGTAAIEIALRALNVGSGDEVLVPPYTFVATASAPLMVGATPIFCDIEYDTFNIDPKRLEEAITPKTRAIIPVHFAGQAADMAAILDIARRRGLAVLEDAAHAHGASWNGRGLGAIGDAGTFSFQSSKNMTAGEGGLILTNDQDLAELCRSYTWGGRKAGGNWYEHHRLSSNYRMTEFQGAILLQQLKRLRDQNAKRVANGSYLNARLSKIPGIHPLKVRSFATLHSFHLYVLTFDEAEFGIPRQSFLQALQTEGIPCSGGYGYPLYKNPMFLTRDIRGHEHVDYASFESLCPNAERACREAIWLEHRLLLGSTDDMDDICKSIEKIYELRAEFGLVMA